MRLARGSLVMLIAALLTGCGSTDNIMVTSTGPLPSGVFVSQYASGSGDTGGGTGWSLSLFDATSGRHLRDLVHLQDGSALRLAGYSRSSDGTITYALGRGPAYQGHVAGGAPKAGTCGGTVYQVSADTGLSRGLFTVGPDRTIQAPEVSPDGSRVAYLSHACTEAPAQRVVIRDLVSDNEHSLGVPAAAATNVSWASDGDHLVVTGTFPAERTPGPGFIIVSARDDGPQPPSAVRHAPDDGCLVVATVFAGPGIQLIEGCPNVVTAPARLVQLDATGSRVLWRADTGLCPNGMTLAPHGRGDLLVTGTADCGAPDGPVDVVQSWTGKNVREIGRYVNPQHFVVAAR